MSAPTIDAPTTIYLLRHGATAQNEARPVVLQGSGIDGPLSPRGEQQAAAAGRLLASRRLAAIYSSTMRRARQTAAAIAASHQLVVTPVEGLQEIHVGCWEGRSWPEISTAHPEAYRRFIDNPVDVPYLGGECYRDVLQRAIPALSSVVELHPGAAVAVVAHNVVNKMLLAHALGLPLQEARRLQQDNCAVNVLTCSREKWQVVTLNSVWHLTDDAPPA